MAEGQVFEPVWLYHPERSPEYVESQEHYDLLMATGTWGKSPADFGQVTAPSREQASMQPSTGADATSSTVTLATPTVEAATLQLVTRCDALESRVSRLEEQLAAQGTDDDLRAQLQTLQNSVQGLNTRVTALVQSADDEPSGGSGRRR
jgi:hypothetical protein